MLLVLALSFSQYSCIIYEPWGWYPGLVNEIEGTNETVKRDAKEKVDDVKGVPKEENRVSYMTEEDKSKTLTCLLKMLAFPETLEFTNMFVFIITNN